jgi:hypothetical protein
MLNFNVVIEKAFFFLLNFVVCPLAVAYCNRLLRLGRPWGAVMWVVIIWRWNAKVVLNLPKPKPTNYPDYGHHGDPPAPRENSHCRAGNRTRDLMISSQRLWPLDHEVGLIENTNLGIFCMVQWSVNKKWIWLRCCLAQSEIIGGRARCVVLQKLWERGKWLV